MDPKISFGVVRRSTLKVPKDAAGAVFAYVAVRDGRGDFAVASGTVLIAP